jgi:hypothetical protein
MRYLTAQGVHRAAPAVFGAHVERDLGEAGGIELFLLGDDARHRALFVLQAPQQVGRRSACARPSSRETTPSLIEARDVLLESLRAFGHRLFHRFLDARQVSLSMSSLISLVLSSTSTAGTRAPLLLRNKRCETTRAVRCSGRTAASACLGE